MFLKGLLLYLNTSVVGVLRVTITRACHFINTVMYRRVAKNRPHFKTVYTLKLSNSFHSCS